MWGIVGAVALTVFFAVILTFGHATDRYWSLPLLVAIDAVFFLSILTPFIIIAIRHQVRLTRIKLIDLFAKSFGIPRPGDGWTAGEGAKPTKSCQQHEPLVVSFEFVKGKYYVDLDLADGREPSLQDVPRFPMMLHTDWMLLLCALPFMVFSGFGIFILFAPLVEILNPEGSVGRWLWPSMLAVGGSDLAVMENSQAAKLHQSNVLMVIGLAFAGAYFFCLRLFLRAVSVFDLSPVTFLRAFAHMVLSTILAAVLYRFTPSWEQVSNVVAMAGIGAGSAGEAKAAASAGVSKPWLLIAFALGFVPDVGIQYLARQSGLSFKQRYSETETHNKTIPLTILDGVDGFIAFRLEEANIYDVQNLATFNPIMLHIESPFGIYETIDWVAQAQLCTVVGAERFLMLKRYNIRTIFDLERAVLAESAPPETKLIVGSILLCETTSGRDLRHEFGVKTVLPGKTKEADEVAFNDIVLSRVTIPGIEHMVRMIVDDLHVHRLRQIWITIGKRLGLHSLWLADTKRTPSEMKNGEP